ncbi:MAG: hypothetical protein ACI3Y2_05320 [Candidatus Egerieousia sp.]
MAVIVRKGKAMRDIMTTLLFENMGNNANRANAMLTYIDPWKKYEQANNIRPTIFVETTLFLSISRMIP